MICVLTIEQIPQAVELARRVNDMAFSHVITPEQECGFMQYVNVQNLKNLSESHQLVLWGDYEDGRLVGVSAMTNSGHITMLYVDAAYLHRGIARSLMNTMQNCAQRFLQTDRLTVNAMPQWSAGNFIPLGFTTLPQPYPGAPFVPMEKKIQSLNSSDVNYQKKPVKIKYWLLTAGIGLLASIAVMFICTICYYH